MASYSHMITSLESLLTPVDGLGVFYESSFGCYLGFSMKIGVRNLKSMLVCFGKLDDDRIERMHPRLEACIGALKGPSSNFCAMQMVGELDEFRKMVVGAELSNGGMQLEADEVLSIITCAVDNAADLLNGLLHAKFNVPLSAFEVLESLGVQMRFIKNLLRLAMQAGVEDSLLFHIQPIAVKAATAFSQCPCYFPKNITDETPCHGHRFLYWSNAVVTKCSILNRMAADPQVWQAYARALTAIRHAKEEEDAEEKEKEKEKEKEEKEEDILKALLDSFISLLWDIFRRQSESRLKDQYKLIFEKLRFSRAIWKKNGTDKNMRGQVGVLICDAGAFIFLLHQTDDPGRFSDLLERFDVFHAQFELETIPSFKVDHVHQVTSDFTSIKISDDGNGRDLDYSSPTSSHQNPHSFSQVVGFKEDEVQLLLDRLTRGSKQLCIVPICGMAGLGKTTLALQLYNHPSVRYRFQARAWCTISQVLDKKKVLVELLNQILPGDYSKEAEPDLANKLRRSLKGKPCLILLDDIWTAEAWDMLKASFPDDSTGSRIIFTSRCLDIVPHAQHDQRPYLLRLRSESECFDILESKVPHKESWNTELVMDIAKKCNGLPLTVTIVAGLLATSEPESWKDILHHLSSGGFAESALELSYRHLPDYLQPCFLYLGALPGFKWQVNQLIRMWMAEGFVGKRESKRIEDVAREYVDKLIERSLVMAVESRSLGGVSLYQIHDVVHEFCRSKAKQENLFHLHLQSQDQLSDFNEPCNLQRLFIHSTRVHFMETRLFCPRAQSICFFPSGRRYIDTHLMDMSFIIHISRSLKVLDMSFVTLMNDIPSAIELLAQLRYFAIASYVDGIPSSIGNLSNLETFIAHFRNNTRETDVKRIEIFSFPHTFWNLKKLRYVRVRGTHFTLPVENLDDSSSLLELETLKGVCFYLDDGSMEKQMKMFPNIHTLKCTILHRTEFPSLPIPDGAEKIVIPKFLSQLESLAMRGNGGVKFELGSSAENLRKLKLEKVQMSRDDIAVIGKFPNLEVLTLSDILYLEKQLEMEEEEFIKLRVLKLLSSDSLERWTCSDDQAFCLEKLVFRKCSNLEEIPSSRLGDIETLEQIRVDRCSPTLECAVRNIEEVQNDYGNPVQVHIFGVDGEVCRSCGRTSGQMQDAAHQNESRCGRPIY